jgi:hypothetical protein
VRKPYYDKDLTGETGPAPIRRENTIFGFSGPEKPLYGLKIDGINASFGAAREINFRDEFAGDSPLQRGVRCEPDF